MIKKDVSTVLTSSGYGAITPIAPAKVYRTRAGRDGRPQAAPGINNYDSVTLSAPSQGSRFHMGLVSRLSQAAPAGGLWRVYPRSHGHCGPDPVFR